MVTTDLLAGIGAVVPELASTIKTMGGQTRVIFTLAARETVEVYAQPNHDPYHVLEGVYLEECGRVQRTVLAIVYGVALIPGMVRGYAAIRAEQREVSK